MEKIVKDSAKLLGTTPDKVPSAAKKLLEKWKDKRKEHDEALKKFADKQTDKLEFEIRGGLRYLFKEIPGANPQQLQEISRKMSVKDSIIFLVGTTADKTFVFGSAGEDATKKVNVGNVVAEFCKEIGGRGGGSPTLGQGSGPKSDVKDKIAKLRSMWIK